MLRRTRKDGKVNSSKDGVGTVQKNSPLARIIHQIVGRTEQTLAPPELRSQQLEILNLHSLSTHSWVGPPRRIPATLCDLVAGLLPIDEISGLGHQRRKIERHRIRRSKPAKTAAPQPNTRTTELESLADSIVHRIMVGRKT